MTAGDFVIYMRNRGLCLVLLDGSLAIETEEGVAPMTEEERSTLKALKPQIVTFLNGVDWQRVSLYSLDRILEVSVPWSDVALLIAPGCRLARELRAQDPKPGRVWCVCEVLDLLLSGISPEDARRVAGARLALDGAVVGVRQEQPR